jgi:hypothetical protein
MKNENTTTPMNEWGFIGYETLVVLGKSATINKFKNGAAWLQWKGWCFPIPTKLWQV